MGTPKRRLASIRVLVVCTGNICRSPMAAGLLRAKAAARGLAWDVRSAGTAAVPGPATPEACAAVAAYGVDLAGHRGTLVSPALVAGADWTLAMTRAHVRALALVEPRAFARTFTLREAVRRAEALGPRRTDEPFEAWLAELGARRRAADLAGDDPADDVADPIGRPLAAYRATAAQLDNLLDRLLASGWPEGGVAPGTMEPAPPPGPPPSGRP